MRAPRFVLVPDVAAGREVALDPEEFAQFRHALGKTQAELSQLLGVSVRAVCAYEGGWRTIPPHAQRQILFLTWQHMQRDKPRGPCWKVMRCPSDVRDGCPAWELRVGNLCWFINGTHCHGDVLTSWSDKMDLCRSCRMLRPLWKHVGRSVGGRTVPCRGRAAPRSRA
jgi:DNA-binding transcriptional regulator YiaG